MKNNLICIVILLFAFGCTKENNTVANKRSSTDIFPNKVGDTWVYHIIDTTVSGFLPMPDTSIEEYDLTIAVIDSVQLPGGIEANIWVSNYPGGIDTNYVFQKEDTVYFKAANPYYGTADIYERYDKQYIIPFLLHNSWTYTPYGPGAGVTVASQSTIVVGQNNFDNASQIFGYGGMPDAGFIIEEWIANNIGLVKRHLREAGIGGINHLQQWSLVSYHLE